ncbi:hypothetical protein Pmani_033585, partial [Petrolisthes manimaculis]
VEVDRAPSDCQLAALQEQLVAVMLENQHLADEVKLLREASPSEQLRQQLEREKEKSRILMERLQERETKEKEKGEREARDRDRSTREKSLPAGDKSPSLPQRIRKRINQIHKTQSMDVDDGSPGPPSTQVIHPASRIFPSLGDDQKSAMQKPLPSSSLPAHDLSSTSLIVKSPSRGRFAWKRRGLEKSKSLDQSEFLASLNSSSNDGGPGTTSNNQATPSILTTTATTGGGWMEDDQRRESDSDDGDKGGQSDTGDGDLAFGGVGVLSTTSGTLDDSKISWWRRLEMRTVSAVSELLRDFSEVAEEEQPDGDPEGDPLTVKKLKENILRFGSVMRPLTELSDVVWSLVRWESPSATLLALVVYLYCVVCGWLLTLTLTLAIMKLSLNYMKKRGWMQLVLRGLRRGEGGEAVEAGAAETGLGDKFALVLQVARRVQNQLGAVSNAAEKLKNLFLWEHEATQRLYFFLCVLALASILLPAAQLFTLAGMYMGLKLFVLDYIFFRYPRIRLKYDSTSRLWDTLPTDADLERRGEKSRIENGNSSPDLTSFLELFNLPTSETPLPGWQSGRRCTLVNRDRSLTSAFKNGRLYLTNRLGKQQDRFTSSSTSSSSTTITSTITSTRLTLPTNKLAPPSSNRLNISSNSLGSNSSSSSSNKGGQGVKLSSSFKLNTDLMRRASCPPWSHRSQSDAGTSLTSGFSFLGMGVSRLGKAKEAKEMKSDECLDLLERMLDAMYDEDDPISASRLLTQPPEGTCIGPKSLQICKSHDSTPVIKEPPLAFLGRRRSKGLLLHSLSEQCEKHAESPGDDASIKDCCSSLDVSTQGHKGVAPEQESKLKMHKKSRLGKLRALSSDDSKSKSSVIDRLNEHVFYAI